MTTLLVVLLSGCASTSPARVSPSAQPSIQIADFGHYAGAYRTASGITYVVNGHGHLLNLQGDTPTARGIDDQHQHFAIPFIRALFRPAIVEAIRLHVDAKRALCAIDSDYYDALSEDSKRSLTLQGGIFSREQLKDFLAKPHAEGAMRVRRWDDQAKVAGATTPPITHYLDIASRCRTDAP